MTREGGGGRFINTLMIKIILGLVKKYFAVVVRDEMYYDL